MSLLWFVASGHKMVPVQHILDHFRPSDGATWQEVHDNYNWDHHSLRDFVADVRRNGVTRPVPVDYDQDPPQVKNGHTRILAAMKAGVSHVPVRDYEWLDPDDEE